MDGSSSMPLGSVIKGFTLPQRSTNGDLQANIIGEQAEVVSLNRITILGLKVDLFASDGKTVTTVITSPECDYWNLDRRLSSSHGVVITRPESRITADAVDWDFKTQVALLHQHVRVVLPKFSIGTPATP